MGCGGACGAIVRRQSIASISSANCTGVNVIIPSTSSGQTNLLLVDQEGVACHTGRRSCFFRGWRDDSWAVLAEPLVAPETLYRETPAPPG